MAVLIFNQCQQSNAHEAKKDIKKTAVKYITYIKIPNSLWYT